MKHFIAVCLTAGAMVISQGLADQPRLDHVVLAVEDIGIASQLFVDSGFRLKQGKPHDNGLINSFIEFSDGSEIELMSVNAPTDDPLAMIYTEFLSRGEGGIFVALGGIHLVTASAKLSRNHIDHRLQTGRLWNYLTFPAGSGLEHVFLIEMHRGSHDPDSTVEHRNGASGIEEIWLESSDRLETMLQTLNIHRGQNNRGFRMSNAWLRPVPASNPGMRPRITGIVLTAGDGEPPARIEAHGIWIQSPVTETGENQ